MVKKSRSKSSKEKKSKKKKLEERSSPRTEEEDAYRQIDKLKRKETKVKGTKEKSLEDFIETLPGKKVDIPEKQVIDLTKMVKEIEKKEKTGVSSEKATEEVISEEGSRKLRKLKERPVKEAVKKLVEEGKLPKSIQGKVDMIMDKIRDSGEKEAKKEEGTAKKIKKKAKKAKTGNLIADSPDSLFGSVTMIKLVIIFIVLAFIIGLAAAL